ncbi:aminoglycoside phosphotransferase family protein [Mycobacterium sp. GA-2829]|uniref:aminoglycoside phosphotransferase family protein n=1 Tax=Mycobacterium sp. GA-2829 TaxID=1772283 RepID=UPI00073FC3B8|nr:aminoglycoside phosphotransferase family protein [Mycobacterium sp. GA-2829]KUI28588.1 aminoglycoside resistance protein [Mycobacterium sp. GA-2829]
MSDLPDAVQAMAARGPRWAQWVQTLPAWTQIQLREWELRVDGAPTHGTTSLVLPVRTPRGQSAILKLGFPDDESEHEHLALRRWAGYGAVRLLSAQPHRRALLLERVGDRDLRALSDVDACVVVCDLYRRIHVPALPQLRSLPTWLDQRIAELAALPRNSPVPHRLVEQALGLARDLHADPASRGTLVHTDLHYANVLATDDGADRPWVVIDPKPLDGDPHFEIAPMLWNRWDELAGDVRDGVRRRFYTLVDTAGFDEHRARAWVIVRMVHNAVWELQTAATPDPAWLTVCVAVAKAVVD